MEGVVASMTLFGPDLSRFQAGINLAQVAAEGCRFVICKVSQGSTWRDPAWPTFRDDARKAGLILAGYHMIDRSNPVDQAANCKAELGDTTIPLALDWEESGGGGDWRNFMAVLQAFRGAGLNVRLAYCPRWWWQAQGSPDMSQAGIPLWSSRYVNTTSGSPTVMYGRVGLDRWDGYGGLPVALLQFTDKAAIAGRQVDCSAFRGTETQLRTLLSPPSTTGAFMALTDAEQLEILASIRALKPGLVLPARSINCRTANDDQFGWSMNAAAEAADARALATQLQADVAALRQAVAQLAAKLDAK